jgi:hypothetical protein
MGFVLGGRWVSEYLGATALAALLGAAAHEAAAIVAALGAI